MVIIYSFPYVIPTVFSCENECYISYIIVNILYQLLFYIFILYFHFILFLILNVSFSHFIMFLLFIIFCSISIQLN